MFAVIKSVVIQNYRNPKYMIFSTIFPIFLIILLGNVLQNEFKSSEADKTTTPIYYLEEQKENKTLDILEKIIDNSPIKFKLESVSSIDEGTSLSRENDGVLIEFENQQINIYSKAGNEFICNSIEMFLEEFKNKENVIKMAYENNKEPVITEIPAKVTIIENGVSQTSFDYYGIAELTMIILYIMLFPLSKIKEDRDHKIYSRSRMSGMSNLDYYGGNIIGHFLLSFIITMPTFLFNIFILKTNWGDNPLMIYGCIQIFALAIISVGVVIGAYFKDTEKSALIVQSVIFPVMAFLGGAYVAMPDDVGGIFQIVTNISPLRWLNRGIFNNIYNDDTSIILVSVVSNIIIFIVCLIIIRCMCNKKEDRI